MINIKKYVLYQRNFTEKETNLFSANYKRYHLIGPYIKIHHFVYFLLQILPLFKLSSNNNDVSAYIKMQYILNVIISSGYHPVPLITAALRD